MSSSENQKVHIWDRYPASQRLCINLLLKCNLSCFHCNVHSNPHRAERLDTDTAIDALKQGWVIGKRHVTFSGGEIFLEQTRLLDIVGAACEVGYSIDVESNAYWARSERRALEVLRPLAMSGLEGLVLSADAFHTREMPLEKTINAAHAGRKLGLLVEVNFCPCGDSAKDNKILESLSLARITPIMNPLLGIGRAKDELTLSDERLAIGDLMDCDGQMMTLHADGQVFSCCEIDASKDALSPAPIRSSVVEAGRADLFAAERHALVLRAFYNPESPLYFRKLTHESGPFSDMKSREFTSICDFCRKFFSDPARLVYLQKRLGQL